MSYVRFWVHLVFTTKYRKPILENNIRYEVFNHISENCKSKKIHLKIINGHVDHVHCLISLGKDQSIAQIAQLIKGESSFWINKNKLTKEKFQWQDDYYADSVNISSVNKVFSYIKNQEEHHKTKNVMEEIGETFKDSSSAIEISE